jgi:hypothetical protein
MLKRFRPLLGEPGSVPGGARPARAPRPAASRGRLKASLANLGLVALALVASLLAGEALARILDGRGIAGGPVFFGTPQRVAIDRFIERVGPGPAPPQLWRRSPPPLPNRKPVDPADLRRLQEFGDQAIATRHSGQVTFAELFKVWNARLASAPCQHDILRHLTRWPLDFFEPADGEARPPFRFPPNATIPTGLVTNQMGWRGKPIARRTGNVVRIVFVGGSTIAEAHFIPFSAPELLEEWLNAWARAQGRAVRFEVLNAGREGVPTADVAAIVRTEVAPLRPDLVIFYEGALSFDWSSVVPGAAALKALARPRYQDQAGWIATLARRSSLVAHGLLAAGQAGWAAGAMAEPAKPHYEIAWPAGLDERDPDIERSDLPLNLRAILDDLERMRRDLSRVGSEFALSSFAWLVRDGLKVDPVRGRYIWTVNNDLYWPWTYRDIRRGVDFENRVYRKFAAARGMPFLDVAARIPADPAIFADAVHMTESGVRVKAWAFMQELLALVEQRLAEGAWPRGLVDHSEIVPYAVLRRSFDCSKGL